MLHMNEKPNYQRQLDRIIEEQAGERPTLLLHSCCAPCSSYSMEYLSRHFQITVYYYNPNITDEKEYRFRASEQRRLIEEMELAHPVDFVEGPYEPQRYLELVKGLEAEPEGGSRCTVCFRMRLEKAAEEAARRGMDYVTTTLTISPLKDAHRLNTIGQQAAQAAGVLWLPSDLKKKNGYRRSVELSGEYGLYRQDYCGCVFSKRERRTKER